MIDIILTGAKHSGKTTVGKILTSILLCDFIDLDELIFQKTGKTPRQLFIENPDIFRQNETDAITTLFNRFPAANFLGGKRIIATGGGIIDNPDALAILNKTREKSTVVYLSISADCAWRRISQAENGELPPFLQTENPQETHRILHERRSTDYRQLADIIIEAEEKSSEQIAEEIKGKIKFA